MTARKCENIIRGVTPTAMVEGYCIKHNVRDCKECEPLMKSYTIVITMNDIRAESSDRAGDIADGILPSWICVSEIYDNEERTEDNDY